MRLRAVLLPHPDGPRRPTSLPSGISILKLSTAVTGDLFRLDLGNIFVRSLRTIFIKKRGGCTDAAAGKTAISCEILLSEIALPDRENNKTPAQEDRTRAGPEKAGTNEIRGRPTGTERGIPA